MEDKIKKRLLVRGVEQKNHFSNCIINHYPTDGRLMAINDKYLALACLGKGSIKLLDSSQPINLINYNSIFKSEDFNILDMEFSPFDSNLLCFSNENNHVFLSKINYKSADNIEFNSEIYFGHEKKVNFVNFNPIASNIMVSGTSYGDIHIWESKEFKTYMQFRLPYNPNTILWSPNGDLIGVTTKNKFLTIYDPRNRNAVFQDQISQNSLITKFAWLDNNNVATVGINSDNKKVLSILDIRKFFLSSIEIDQYTLVTVPYVNPELKLIYCVGKEENSIKVFDYCTGSLQKNNEFRTSEQNNFSVLLNRQYLNKSKMEVDRFARYTRNKNIFYISFYLSSGQNFDGILYPSEEFKKPQMNSNDWINGKKFDKPPTILYQRKIHSNNNNRLIEQNNKTEKKNNSARKFFDEIVNIEKNAKNDDSKLSNSTPKNKDSNISKKVDNENLNKDFEKEHKSLESKIIDLQNLLI